MAFARLKTILEYERRVWQSQDGLPEETVQAITETPNGYLWIGTRMGLARFDGVQFTVFDRSNTVAFHDDSVLSLCATKGGALWIGTEGGGLVRDVRGAFTYFGAAKGLTNGFVRVIYQDRSGNLLIGTDHGLFRKAGNRFVRTDGRGGLPYVSVHAIMEDRAGRLWVGGSGLYVLDGGSVRKIVLAPSAAANQIKSIFQSRDGTIWVGAYAGLYRLKDGKILHTPFDRDVEADICQDQTGNVWVGWVGGGLSRFYDGKFHTYHAPEILPSNTVLSIFEDSERDLWVGTENGLLRLSDTGVSVLENRDGVSLANSSTIYENVSTIYQAPGGKLWIANGHLYQIKSWQLIPYRLAPQVAGVKVRTVFVSRNGALWLGTGGQGVVAIRHGVATQYTTRQGLINDFIRAFCQDRDGNLWIGTDGGLSRWDGKHFKNFNTSNGLAYPSVRAIVQDDAGNVWVGTDGGLSLIRHGGFVHIPILKRLRGDKIWTIHNGRNEGLWLGTRDDGIYELKRGRLIHYTTRCGLPNDNIYQILQDWKGNFWFSSRAGIFQISLNSLAKGQGCKPGILAPTLYGNAETAEAGETDGGVQPAGSSTRSGVLWFPTSRGAIRIEPEEVRWSRVPRALIDRVVADGRNVPVTGRCRIAPGEGRLEIYYTAPSLRAPERVYFRYRLVGFDREWTSTPSRRVAYYTNLPPGQYRFRLIAYYNGAPAGESTEADFAFTWEAHFYRTAWFYLLCGVCAGGLAWFGFRLHAAQTKARYAAVLSERSRLAREMHDTVIQGCVAVSTLLEAVSSLQPTPQGMARDLVDRARAQIRQTLHEARDAVWNLRYTTLEGDDLAAILTHLARQFSSQSGVKIQTEISEASFPSDQRVKNNLLLVAREALRNALTHARARNVLVRLALAKEGLTMEVKDDGCGFDVFSAGASERGHYGILGMRERIEQLGGQLSLVSDRGKGTQVLVTLPLPSLRTMSHAEEEREPAITNPRSGD